LLAASLVVRGALAQPTPATEPPAGQPPSSAPSPPIVAITPLVDVASPDRPRAAAWEPDYLADPGLADWLTIGAGASLALGTAVASPQPKHWRGGALFDEGVRDALRLKTLDGRYRIRDASDVSLSLEVTWPFFVDALVTAWYVRGDAALARRMAIVDAEAIAIVAGVQGAATTVASRERPYGRDCGGTLPNASVDCSGNVRYRSFFSGHSALSFASASLVCVHHLEAGLLGGPWDAVSCVGAYGVAAMTGTFRIMGDMHYATDVLTGALFGSAIGLGVPLLHAHRGRSRDVRAGEPRVDVVPVGAGVGLGGTF
jgi:membrane-associated phospholipid phosphatase